MLRAQVGLPGSGLPRCQPRNRRVADRVRPCDFSQCLARFAPGDGLLALMLSELELPAEPHAPGLRSLAPLVGPGQDQMPLKLRQSPEDRKHQSAVWRCCISPRITKRLEPRTNLADGR